MATRPDETAKPNSMKGSNTMQVSNTTPAMLAIPNPERIRIMLDRLLERAEEAVAEGLAAKAELAKAYRDAISAEHVPYQVQSTIERTHRSHASTINLWDEIVIRITKAKAANTTMADDLLTLANINQTCACRVTPTREAIRGEVDATSEHVRLAAAVGEILTRTSDAFVHVADDTQVNILTR